MKIFVINLKHSLKRRKIMEEQLNKLKLPFEFFEAVQGSSLTEEEILNYYDHDYYKNRPHYFTPGAAGCTLSHYFLYEKIVAEGIDCALILEDDMQLNKNLPSMIQKLYGQIRGDEVIMLFYQSYYQIKLSEPTKVALNSNYHLYQVADADWLRSTGGYIITLEAAKTMTKKLVPFSSFPDDWKSFYDRKIINGVRLVYPFLMENTYEPTTISPNIKGGNFVKKIIPFIEKYRVFPAYQALKLRRKIKIGKTRQCVFINEQPTDYREK